MRHKNQTKGFAGNRPLSPRTQPPTTPRARELLARSRGGVAEAPLPMKPPHVHRWEGGRCKVCGDTEISST